MAGEPQADCLFCKIVAGDVPATVVRETETTVAFRDINPQAPTHVLVIPKVHYPDAASLAAAEPAIAADVLREAGRGRRRREDRPAPATGSSSTPAPAPARPSSTPTRTSWAAAASAGPPDRRRVRTRAGGAGHREPGAHPAPQPQRLPAALGRRGHALRPRRGHPAPDAARRGRRARHQPDLRHALPRRPLPGPRRGDPAHQPRPGAAPRHRALPGERAALLRPAAVRHRLPRDGRAHARSRSAGDGRPRARRLAYALDARLLSHPVESYGYRLTEPDGRRMLPELLAAHGIARAGRRPRSSGRANWAASRSTRSASPGPGSGSPSSWTPGSATACTPSPRAATCWSSSRPSSTRTSSWPLTTAI